MHQCLVNCFESETDLETFKWKPKIRTVSYKFSPSKDLIASTTLIFTESGCMSNVFLWLELLLVAQEDLISLILCHCLVQVTNSCTGFDYLNQTQFLILFLLFHDLSTTISSLFGLCVICFYFLDLTV